MFVKAARLVLGAALLAAASPAMATFVVSVEAAGVQNTTSTFNYSGVETFDSRSTGSGQSFTSTFVNSGGNSVSGTYSGVQVNAADQYGGAGGTGNYATTFSTTGYTLALSQTGTQGVNYFGYWLSALDSGNQVSFYKGNTLVYSFSPSQLSSMVGSSYNGNPNSAYAGQNGGQPYAFLNFYDQGDTFDKVVFAENPQNGGYESDNHTIGNYKTMSGTVVSGVPEPSSWAMLIVGFGAIGMILRGRKAQVHALHR